MAEKSTTRKRSSRQAVVELVTEAEKAVAERREADAKPEQRAAAKALAESVAVADALSSDDVVRSIGDLKSTIARTLSQLSERLEDEVGKYNQVRRAIAAKDAELQEIYEIQRSASTLQAMIETHERQRAASNSPVCNSSWPNRSASPRRPNADPRILYLRHPDSKLSGPPAWFARNDVGRSRLSSFSPRSRFRLPSGTAEVPPGRRNLRGRLDSLPIRAGSWPGSTIAVPLWRPGRCRRESVLRRPPGSR
jgi:hypothetical protein